MKKKIIHIGLLNSGKKEYLVVYDSIVFVPEILITRITVEARLSSGSMENL